ncbi:ABC transporter ATP-binding protein [Leuconostocaceae bacterium ESL0958]|nr:ABC transporter ATP-binding protein [Leuconostocaceae bacterium ESL0958]
MQRFKETIGYFYHYLKPAWRGLLLALLLLGLGTYAQVTAPLYLGNAVAALSDYLKTVLTAPAQASLHDFYRALGFLIFFYLLSESGQTLSGLAAATVTAKATSGMRKGLFAKLQRLPLKFFDRRQDGQILSLFTSDMDNLQSAMSQAVFSIFSQGMVFIGIIVMMLRKSFTMALVTMALSPVAILLSLFIIKRARLAIQQQQAATGDLNGYINEQLAGQAVLIAEGRQQESVTDFTPYNEQVRSASQRGQFYSGLLGPLMQGLSLLNLAIVIFFGSWLALHTGMGQAAGLSLVVVFVSYSQQYFQPISQLASIYNSLQLAMTGVHRVNEVATQPEERADQGRSLPPLSKAIRFDHVDFAYQPDQPILKDINFQVAKGETLALVGPTGSGKTTIINLLSQFYDLSAGRILFDGIDLSQVDLSAIRSRIGLVLQDTVLFSKSVADNIRYGRPAASQAAVIAAAKQAQIHDFIMTLPEQYDTMLSADSGLFSAGQKQLLSIARTIITDPDVLILDEATANVDTVTEAQLNQATQAVTKDRTAIIIAHRLKTILDADQIIVLKNGAILESGTHAQLLAQKGFYADLYHDQMDLT